MNDLRDHDTDPTAARLRHTLDAASDVPFDVDAGLRDLEGRLDGTTVVRLDPPARRSRRPRLLAAAAACVVVAAGIVGAAIVTSGGDDDGNDPAVLVPPTGWYVPTSLPDGWTLRAVTSDYRDVGDDVSGCPCAMRRWIEPDGPLVVDEMLVESFDPDPDFVAATALTPIDLGDVGTGSIWQLADDGRGYGLYSPADRQVAVVGGVSRGRAIEIATAVFEDSTDDRTFDAAAFGLVGPAEGFVSGTARSYRAVTATFDTPDGPIGYTITPAGLGDVRVWLQGGPAPAAPSGPVRVWPNDGSGVPLVLAATWPGADLVIGDPGLDGTASAGPHTAAQLRTLADALRPATTEEWVAFVDSANPPIDPTRRNEVVAGSIDALIDS